MLSYVIPGHPVDGKTTLQYYDARAIFFLTLSCRPALLSPLHYLNFLFPCLG